MSVEQGFAVNERIVTVGGKTANVIEYADSIVYEYDGVSRSYERSIAGLEQGFAEWMERS